MPFQITPHTLFVRYEYMKGEEVLLMVTDVHGQIYFLEPESESFGETYYRFHPDFIPESMLNEIYASVAQTRRLLFHLEEARQIVQASMVYLPTEVYVQTTQLTLLSERVSWTSAPLLYFEEVTPARAREIWLHHPGPSES